MKSLRFITFASITACQFMLSSTAHAQGSEYFCAATDAILLDFLNIPNRPLYMQGVSTESENIKVSRYEKSIKIKDNMGREVTYPMLKLGYKKSYVDDFFVAAEGQAYFQFEDGLAVYSHTNMITSYKCERF